MKFFRKRVPSTIPPAYKTLNPHIGILIRDLDDITKIDSSQIEELKALVRRYSVVVIKGKRTWTEKEQKTFTNQLGKLELPVIYSIPPTQLKEEHKGSKIKKGSGVFWHSDNSYQEKPSYLSVFQMVEIPESGTKTSFASLVNLCKNLPESDKKLWRNLGVVYRDTVTHPLLWKHPFNKVNTIYFDIGFSTDIRNYCDDGKLLPVRDSNQIFTCINNLLSNEASLIEHPWEPGDIEILDNYAVAHRADILMEKEKRTLLRMTTEGVHF